MTGSLEGRVAFVTDGWHSVGALITDGLLSSGVKVGVGYHRKDPDLDKFLTRRSAEPLSVHQGSLAEAEDCRRAIGELVRDRGRLDILVVLLNFRAAGMFSTRRSLNRLSGGEWQRTVEAHLSGGFHVAQAALAHMIRAGFGRIIFVLGTAGVGDGLGQYATIRGAVQALSRELARDLAGSGVTVNRVSTGVFNDEVLAGLPKEAVDQAIARIPVHRFAEPSEITRVVEFLAHPDSGYLTGQLLAVDGGLTLDMI
jgi:NAD(P)-dependent dehydrogenase (short-subunit alcohol dehydrogenase family)